MPQMAPIGWLSLFIIFSMTFILFNVMNYYSILPSIPQKSEKKTFHLNPMNWKW